MLDDVVVVVVVVDGHDLGCFDRVSRLGVVRLSGGSNWLSAEDLMKVQEENL